MIKHGPCIALVGAPNCGKTTVFNWLTGSRFKTVNYPGATVEYALGSLQPALGSGLRFMDTPGVYGLNPKSADEEVTYRALFDRDGVVRVDGVVVIIDGTQLQRHLPLVLTVLATGFPVMVVATMADLLAREKLKVDWAVLSRDLGVEVIPFEGLLGGGLTQVIAAAKRLPPRSVVRPPSTQLVDYQQRAGKLVRAAMKDVEDFAGKQRHLTATTRRLDRIFLHPFLGLLLFFLIMSGLFTSIYSLAQPLMDAVDWFFSTAGDTVRSLAPEALWSDFAARGVIASFGAVLVFVPQIFILFLGIGLLEATGYLARAATLIDRPLSALGLTGRSFVPLLSGFSCAVPALMATRNIPSRRDRWITNFILPLMTCSARLPVYALLLSFLFQDRPAWQAGLALTVLYVGAMVVGALTASVLNRFIAKDEASRLLMELPLYRRPRLRVTVRQAMTRTWGYVRRAGPVIFVIAVLLWWGSNFPNYDLPDQGVKLEQSYAGRAGRWLEPLVRPLGVDWRVGVGLISAFAAREVFVSTLALTFHTTNEDEATQTQGLLQAMKGATFADGRPVFTPASVVGLLIFFMIAMQCMSTLAVAVRETGSWVFAWSQLISFNIVAYVLAVVAVQSLRLLGW